MQEASSNSRTNVYSRLVLGDKFGNLHLLDASRKLVLCKKEIEAFKGRRIISLSSATLEWVDTRLVYIAVVARGSPVVSVLGFKLSENKFYHFYSINVAPQFDNADSLEQNDGQKYDKLPAEGNISVDGEFLTVTCFDGSVKVIKMPPVIDPLKEEDKSVAADAPSDPA